MRKSSRKKNKINYNESHDCNDVTDNNGSSGSSDTNDNNVSPNSKTMTMRNFMPLLPNLLLQLNQEKGNKSTGEANYSTFKKYIERSELEEFPANDLLSPSHKALFTVDPKEEPNAKKRDNKQRNINHAYNNVRKCFLKNFQCDPEDTGSPMPRRQVLKRNNAVETEEESSVSKYLQYALNEKLISKEDLRTMTEYYKYRCQHRQNSVTKGNPLYPDLEEALVKKIRNQNISRNWNFRLPHIQQLYLQRIGDQNKDKVTFLIERLEHFIQQVKSQQQQLFAEAVEEAEKVSMFNDEDDIEE